MGQINWKINHKFFPELDARDLDFLISEFRSDRGLTIKDSPRRTVKKIELNGENNFFIKHIKIIGWDTTLKYFILFRKIFTEWEMMNRIFALGIPTPYPVAFGIYKKFGLFKEGFLITKSLGDTIT
ncbi:MAG: hypothetical protein N3A64_03215, partial [Desulfobacterota bacterium]|nr:hypothetical protein [Thermodesulfobacteriota bacterium]